MAPTPTSHLSPFPVPYSVTGQTLHFDPSVPANTITAGGGTSTNNFLQRYYGGSLAGCRDPNYVTPSEPFIQPGMCGWTNSIAYRGDTENTEFDALQITLAKQYQPGPCRHRQLPVGVSLRRYFQPLDLEP